MRGELALGHPHREPRHVVCSFACLYRYATRLSPHTPASCSGRGRASVAIPVSPAARSAAIGPMFRQRTPTRRRRCVMFSWRRGAEFDGTLGGATSRCVEVPLAARRRSRRPARPASSTSTVRRRLGQPVGDQAFGRSAPSSMAISAKTSLGGRLSYERRTAASTTSRTAHTRWICSSASRASSVTRSEHDRFAARTRPADCARTAGL
jgi:hypothetical protein